MSVVRIQLTKWGEGDALIDVQLPVLTCVLAVIAFFCRRSLGALFLRAVAGKRSVADDGHGSTTGQDASYRPEGLLMIFRHLPELPEVVATFDAHFSGELNENNFRAPAKRRVFVHLLTPDCLQEDQNVHQDTTHAVDGSRKEEDKSLENANLTKRKVVAPPIVKKRNWGRLRRLLLGERRKNKQAKKKKKVMEEDVKRREEEEEEEEEMEEEETELCCAENSDTQNGINSGRTQETPLETFIQQCGEYQWERLVRLRAVQLLNKSMPLVGNDMWDVHYLKLLPPVVKDEDFDDDTGRFTSGGVLVRAASCSPVPLLQMALQNGLLCRKMTLHSSDGFAAEPPITGSPVPLPVLSFLSSYLLGSFLYCLEFVFSNVVHMLHVLLAFIRWLWSLHWYCGNNQMERDGSATRTYFKPTEEVPGTLWILPSRATSLLQRIAEHVNKFALSSENRWVGVCVHDVASAVNLGTLGRVMQQDVQDIYAEEKSSSSNRGSSSGVAAYISRIFFCLTSVSVWLQRRCRMCQALSLGKTGCNSGFFTAAAVAASPVATRMTSDESTTTTTTTATKEEESAAWTSDEAMLNRLLGCVERRVRAAEGLPPYPTSTALSLNVPTCGCHNHHYRVGREVPVYYFGGYRLHAMYCTAMPPIPPQRLPPTPMYTAMECGGATCSTLWLPHHSAWRTLTTTTTTTTKTTTTTTTGAAAATPLEREDFFLDELSQHFMEELLAMANLFLGLPVMEALEASSRM
ncbi:hypothetical protein MOQ_005536 [Trypanosoma cruzi marinkellei]|uniref:Uncharacterized protein n=1 Tax=Trypanosoma cruzi marinkellei TaxID=85056 RepID=K2M6U0_TRYCR|nr:hypothetical protein MOQ_005536 [Trypanosoma cruzi marinkellei]